MAQAPAFIEKASAVVHAFREGMRVLAFGHVGDGSIHFNLFPPEGGEEEAFAVIEAAGGRATSWGGGAAGEREACLAAGAPRIHADLLARFPDADG